jgi:hypothetical protein
MMKAVLLIGGLMALSSAAHADGVDKLVATFAEACMGERPVTQTVEALAKAKGWSRDEANSRQIGSHTFQSIPIEGINIESWKVPIEGLPGAAVSVSRMTHPNLSSIEICSVQFDTRDETTRTKLKALLNLPEPHWVRSGEITIINWTLSASPRSELMVTEAPRLTSISRSRSFPKEKP